MSYERRTLTGGAAATTISAGISSLDTSISITASTGWPTGSTGDFFVVIDRGTASEEKVRISSRTGTSLTVASSGRGADGSTAGSHSSGATIELCVTALDLDEANLAVNKTIGQATAVGQILVVDGTNSFAAVQAKTSGQILQGNGTTLASVAMSGDVTIASGGATTIGAQKVGVSKMTVSASPRLLGRTTASAGAAEELSVDSSLGLSAGTLQRAALTGDVTASAGSNATTIGNSKVVTAMLNNLAVTNAKIAANAVTLDKLDSTLRGITLSATEPVGPTAGDFYWNTSSYALYEYTTATTGFQPPWNLPWGVVGTPATASSNQTGITTLADVTSLSVTFTAVANRRYRLSAFILVQSTSGTPAYQVAEITNSSNTVQGSAFIGTNIQIGSNDIGIPIQSRPVTFSAGSVTVKVRFGQGGADTATYRISNATQNGWLMVEDIGPSTSPA